MVRFSQFGGFNMKRRQFVVGSASTLILMGLLACGDDSEGSSMNSGGDGDQGDGDRGDGDRGDGDQGDGDGGDGDQGDGDQGDGDQGDGDQGDGDQGDGDGGDGDQGDGDGDGDGDAGVGDQCENGAKDTAVSNQHPGGGEHHVTIPKADLSASSSKTYMTTGTHTHKITLSAAQLKMLAEGKSVTVTSTRDNSHTHDITVSCD